MPNGGPEYTDEQWGTVKSFFNKNSETIFAFSNNFNLFIDKYYHGSSSWDLRFRHPKGGQASICLSYNVYKNTFQISSNWHKDEYKEFTRYLKWGAHQEFELPVSNMDELLISQLKETLSWEKEQMEPHTGYENPWNKYSESEFEKLADSRVENLRNLNQL